MYMLIYDHGEITEDVRIHIDVLRVHMLMHGHGEISEAVHIQADVWSWRNF